jgi:hypothetical protein
MSYEYTISHLEDHINNLYNSMISSSISVKETEQKVKEVKRAISLLEELS